MTSRVPSGQLSADLEALRNLLPRLQNTQRLRTVLETAPIAADQTTQLRTLNSENVFVPLRLDNDGMDIRAMMWSWASVAPGLTIEADIAIYEMEHGVPLNTIISEIQRPYIADTAYQSVKLTLVPGSEQVVTQTFAFAGLIYQARFAYNNPVRLRGTKQRFLYVRTNNYLNLEFPFVSNAVFLPWLLRSYSASMGVGQRFPESIVFDNNQDRAPAFVLISDEGLQRYFF